MESKESKTVNQLSEKQQMGGLRGNMFQVKLLMLLLFRLLKMEFDFELGTEIIEAKKFDDVVLKYRKKPYSEHNEYGYCLIQAKHKTRPIDKIKLTDILTISDSNFGLIKYFFSYVEAKNETIFSDGNIEHVILYTNSSLDLFGKIPDDKKEWNALKNIKNIIEKVDDQDEIIFQLCKIDNLGKYYRFKPDVILPILKNMIIEYNYIRIAEKIIKSMLEKKPIMHNDVIFRNYHILLANEVLDIKNKKFKTEFVTGLNSDSDELRKFREILNSLLEDKNLNIKKLNEDVNIKFIFSKGFGEQIKHKEQWWTRGDINITGRILKDSSKLWEFNLKEVAKKLTENILNNKIIDKSDNVFKEFHVLLADYVIDVNKNEFRMKFIDFNFEKECEELPEMDFHVRKSLEGLHMFRDIMKNEMESNGIYLESINEFIRKNKLMFKLCKDFGTIGQERIQCWLADDNSLNTIITDFLKKFTFAVDQPNEKQLGDVIRCCLREEYHSLDSDLINAYFTTEMINWMQGNLFIVSLNDKSDNNNRFISYQMAKEFFNKTIRKFNESILKGPTVEYQKLIDELSLDFNNIEIDNNIKHFLNSEKNIFILKTQHIIISSINLYYSLYKNLKEIELINKHDNSFIYLRLSKLIESSMSVALKAFQSQLLDNLMVIECDLSNATCLLNENQLTNMFDEIFDILQNNNRKKVLIIAIEDNFFVKMFQDVFSSDDTVDEKFDGSHHIMYLSTYSQQKILEKKVTFQNHEVCLNDLINDESMHLIDDTLLLNFMKNEDIAIGKEYSFVQNNYMYRNFSLKLKYNNDVFFISGIYEKYLYTLKENRQLKIIDDSMSLNEKESNIFMRLKTKYHKENIYMFSIENDQITLKKKSEKSSHTPNQFTQHLNDKVFNNNLILIASEPGMGKSSVLCQLCRKIKEHNPSLWVYKIDLHIRSKELNDIHKENRKIDMDIVKQFLMHCFELELSIEKQIFEQYLQQNKIVIFFDGIDEISPRYTNEIINIVKVLQSEAKIKQIWMSTRQQNLNDITSVFNLSPWKLEPLLKNDHVKYLEYFWQTDLKSPFNLVLFDLFVSKLFQDFGKIANTEFLDITLHMIMIAEIFKSLFETANDSTDPDIHKLNHEEIMSTSKYSVLYKKFIEIKFYKVFCQDKTNLNLQQEAGKHSADTMYENFLEKNRLLSLNSIFGKDERLLTEQYKIKLKKIKTDIEKNGDKTGIVNCIINDEPHFVHRTYAEFFIADWFTDLILGEKVDRLKTILPIILQSYNLTILSFIDNNMLEEKQILNGNENIDDKLFSDISGSFLHFVMRNKLSNITRFLIQNGIDLTYCREYDETVFHLACHFDHEPAEKNIFMLLFTKMESNIDTLKNLLRKKKNFSKSVLHEAFRFCDIENIMILMKLLNEINMLNDALLTKDIHDDNVLDIAIMFDSRRFNIIFNYLKKHPNILKTLLCNKINNGESVLHQVVECSSLETVQTFMDKYEEFDLLDYILTAENRENNILHLASINSRSEVLFYLLTYLKTNKDILKILLKQKNYDGDLPICIAINNGHHENVKAFIETFAELDILEEILSIEDDRYENFYFKLSSVFPEYLDDMFSFHMNDKTKESFKEQLKKKNIDGQTPLQSAIKNSFKTDISQLIKIYDDFNILENALCEKDIYDQNALHHAAKNSNLFYFLAEYLKSYPDLLKKLMNDKNSNGQTPLYLLFGNNPIQVKDITSIYEEFNDDTLLKLLSVTDNNNQNIFHCMASNRWSVFNNLDKIFVKETSILKVSLLQQNSDGKLPLHCICETGFHYQIKYFLDAYKKLNILNIALIQEDNYKQNIFHHAAYNFNFIGYENFVDLKNNVDVLCLLQKKNMNGETPLLLAVRYCNLENVKFIFDFHKDLDILENNLTNVNNEHQNIFHLAATSHDPGTFRYVINRLFEYYDLSKNLLKMKNVHGDTPLLVFFKGFTHFHFYEVMHKIVFMHITDYELMEKGELIGRYILREEDNNFENIFHIAICKINYYHFMYFLNYDYIFIEYRNYVMKPLLQKRNIDGKNSLHYAAEKGSMKTVTFLIDALHEIKIFDSVLMVTDNDNQNIFHLGAINENSGVLPFLITQFKCHNLISDFLLSENVHGQIPLHVACKMSDLDGMKALFDIFNENNISESALMHKDNNGQNILHLAAINPNNCIMEYILKTGDKNMMKELLIEKNENGRTPLLCIAEDGIEDDIKAIINIYCEMDMLESELKISDNDDNNIFHLLAANQDYKILEFVIMQLKTNRETLSEIFQKKNKRGHTPLHCYSEMGSVEEWTILFETLIEIDLLENLMLVEDSDDQNLMHFMCINVNDVIQFVIKQLKSNSGSLKELLMKKNKIGKTPLHCAFENSQKNDVEILISLFSDDLFKNALLVTDNYGNNIFHFVTLNGDKEVIEYMITLFENNIDILYELLQKPNIHGQTPFHLVCKNGFLDIVEIMIKLLSERNMLSAMIEIEDNKCDNIFHFVASNEHNKVFQHLISLLKNNFICLKDLLRKKNINGKTPLLCIAEKGFKEDLKILIDEFTEMNILEDMLTVSDNDLNNIFHLSAINNGNDNDNDNENDNNNNWCILQILAVHFGNNLDLIKGCLQKKNIDGKMPLHLASEKGQWMNLKILINLLKEVNALEEILISVDNDDQNFLHLAAVNKNDSIEYLICELKTYPESLKELLFMKNKNGQTPLHCAVENNIKNNIKMLLIACHDINSLDLIVLLEDNNNQNVTQLATIKNNFKFLDYVISHLKETF